VEVSTDTVARVRQRFIEHRPGAALARQKPDRSGRERKLDGRAEARRIALACSRTATDFAEVLRWLVEEVHPETE
jgi:hypothetical protein